MTCKLNRGGKNRLHTNSKYDRCDWCMQILEWGSKMRLVHIPKDRFLFGGKYVCCSNKCSDELIDKFTEVRA